MPTCQNPCCRKSGLTVEEELPISISTYYHYYGHNDSLVQIHILDIKRKGIEEAASLKHTHIFIQCGYDCLIAFKYFFLTVPNDSQVDFFPMIFIFLVSYDRKTSDIAYIYAYIRLEGILLLNLCMYLFEMLFCC